MSKQVKVICPYCENEFSINKSKKLRAHKNKMQPDDLWCEGTGLQLSDADVAQIAALPLDEFKARLDAM